LEALGLSRHCRQNCDIRAISDERLHSNSLWRRSSVQVSTFVHVKDHLRVAICEPLEVGDDIFLKSADRQLETHLDEIQSLLARW